MRVLAASSLLSVVLSHATMARADDVKERCARASEHAQSLRLEGKLQSAKKELLVCAQPECPAVVAHDCQQWIQEVEPGVPTVVLGATDGAGHDLTDVTVTIDGAVATHTLTGKELELDPGPHTFTFDASGREGDRRHAEQKLVIRAGERRRALTVQLEAPGAQKNGTSARRVASYVLFGVGALGVGSFTFFGIEAKNRFDSLQSSCGHRCSDSDVNDVRTHATVADVSLGVGLVAIGVGAYLFFTEHAGSASASTVGAAPWTGGTF